MAQVGNLPLEKVRDGSEGVTIFSHVWERVVQKRVPPVTVPLRSRTFLNVESAN